MHSEGSTCGRWRCTVFISGCSPFGPGCDERTWASTSSTQIALGDVGQNSYEEIDWLAPGTKPPVNFGWNIREGKHEYRSGSTAGLTEPVLDYSHDDGRCSISGVYRGKKIPDLRGTYLYSDNCDGKIRGTAVGTGVTSEEIDFGLQATGVSGFGQDNAKELYVLSLTDGVYRIDPASGATSPRA